MKGPALSSSAVVRFTTTRAEGNARSAGALAGILKSRKLRRTVATAEQHHGSRVVWVPSLRAPRKYAEADGLLTDAKAQPLAIFSADCIPVFLAAPKHGVVGLLHAGWRGVHAGILTRALRRLRARRSIRPQDISIWLGPGICRDCFQVRWAVARYFPTARFRRGTRWTVDLPRQLIRQAIQAGVTGRQVKRSGGCTMHGRKYYSYRRDATEERQVSVIMLKN